MFCIAEALEVHDLAFAQELDGIGNVGIVAESKDVVIGLARLLLCCELIRRTRCEKPP